MSPFGLRDDHRVAVFFDGPSFHHATLSLGWNADFEKLRQHFEGTAMMHRFNYFVALPEADETEQYAPAVRLASWLGFNGFRVFSKPLREFQNTDGRRRVKTRMQVEIAVEMMEAVPFCDVQVLFSGDGELAYAVEAVQRKGMRVHVVSTMHARPIPVAEDLRRAADRFVDLVDVRELISNRRDGVPTSAQASQEAR